MADMQKEIMEKSIKGFLAYVVVFGVSFIFGWLFSALLKVPVSIVPMPTSIGIEWVAAFLISLPVVGWILGLLKK